ncbi:hypothetical protein MLD38_034506 [Melastoma candidum]|uniref:Uncharacterized protein n=1 Tax=Melastoma candidum TaxID=119954 RepID=A0ACB9MA84_9MYRT|nr:hypothetical protein MLD38_034506 [Melastoma candidum]
MEKKGEGFSWVSECGSGVESGWTYYLNDSSYLCSGRSGVSRVTDGAAGKGVGGRYDEDEDGLSLVSDASSGPPHFYEGRSWRSCEGEREEEEEYGNNALFWGGRVVVGREQREDSCFQDTASSAKKSSFPWRNETRECVFRPKDMNGGDYARRPRRSLRQSGSADFCSSGDPEGAHGRRVKVDLTELKQSLARQLWGVANILAPPPFNSSRSRAKDESDREEGESTIGGRDGGFESGSDEELAEDPVVGVKEVLNFARNIAMHPETWLDFPLDPEEDLDDFEMSDAQQEHVLAMENLSLRLSALRIELCP